MSLNKRNGLYSVPSHHLYAPKPAPRQSFNSKDFDELPNIRDPDQPVKDNHGGGPTPQEKKDKTKETQSAAAQIGNAHARTSIPQTHVKPATVNSKGKSSEKGGNVPNGAQSDKKRKRDEEDLATTSKTSGSLLDGSKMMQNVQSSIKAAGAAFGDRDVTTDPAENRTKKKKKKVKAARKSNDTIDFDHMAKETRSIDREERKREKKEKRRSAGIAQIWPPTAVPIPVPASAFSSPPKRTPVPLPKNAFSNSVNAMKADRVDRRDSRLLVEETPLSQVSKTPLPLLDSPIPFNLPGATPATEHKASKIALELSPPTPIVDEAPSSAPPVLSKNHKLQLKPDGRVSLTASNLTRYTQHTQPLSNEPKSRPLPRATSAAPSTAASTTSSMTTPSIKELFSRVGKPYSRSGAEIDPFVVPEVKKKTVFERHEEAGAKEFTERYRAVQKAVNFSDELEYLDSALSWRTSNDALGPLPCLGIKASGCNAKREQVLRLSKEDSSNLLKVLVTTEADQQTLEDAKSGSAKAESLFKMAVIARVPVPIGRLEGVWKLFCPQYSDLHVDKYGYGQRTLTIFSIAGFKDQHSYTARLSIPPRSMLYSILSFSAPPHASFRTTTVKTSAEGYKMDIVFLGNGYLQLRVDLNLLLSGKPTETKEGKQVVMEFVGVHENAVMWEEQKDELEMEGKKLFAKYDGEA
ncbi:hypothetical protein N0V94_004487 [Neodidymelliopsis sp. IMI 364377]|nr:hypothetical protein N0V94_004487 [Neodidymelliopsis sp. IMI 364377]